MHAERGFSQVLMQADQPCQLQNGTGQDLRVENPCLAGTRQEEEEGGVR